jgi:hypothetical protein
MAEQCRKPVDEVSGSHVEPAPQREVDPSASRLELTQRSADIGQRVPVLTGCTVVRRTRRLAGVGDRIPELPVHAVEWLCRADPSAEQRHGGSDGSGCNGGDGRTASKTTHELIIPENADSQTRLSTKSSAIGPTQRPASPRRRTPAQARRIDVPIVRDGQLVGPHPAAPSTALAPAFEVGGRLRWSASGSDAGGVGHRRTEILSSTTSTVQQTIWDSTTPASEHLIVLVPRHSSCTTTYTPCTPSLLATRRRWPWGC